MSAAELPAEATPVEKETAAEALRAAAFLPDRADDAKLRALARRLVDAEPLWDERFRERMRRQVLSYQEAEQAVDAVEAELRELRDLALEALGDQAKIVHSFGGNTFMIGADAALDSALALVEQADEIAWVWHPLAHDLAVRAGETIRYYAVERPERVERRAAGIPVK